MIPIVVQNQDLNLTSKFFDFLKPDELAVHGTFYTVQGEGPLAGKPAWFIRLAGCNFGAKDVACQFCFPPDHPITAVKGRVTFGDINVGDELFALDGNGNVTTTKVKSKLTREVDASELIQLVIDVDGVTQKLVCTKDHPIETSNRGFVPADQLKSSDRIVHVSATAINEYRMRTLNPTQSEKVVAAAVSTRRERFESGMYDLTRSEAQRENYRKSKLGSKNPMKRHDVRLKNALGHNYKKTALESKVEQWLRTVGVAHKYVGAGIAKLAIGDNVNGYRFPDFKLAGKKVIEVYHTTNLYQFGKTKKRRTRANYEVPTRKFYEALGYSVLFLTEKDLPSNGVGKGGSVTDDRVLAFRQKVVAFKNNGAKLLSKSPLRTSALKRVKSNGKVDVVNFSCYPYNTFIVNRIHTHNCDTSFSPRNATVRTIASLCEEFETLTQGLGFTPAVVITGGEPLLQKNVVDLITTLLDSSEPTYVPGTQVQIETNGSQVPVLRDLLDTFYADDDLTVVISPKTVKGSYGKEKDYGSKHGYYYKFVVSADPENPHHSVPDWAPRSRTYVSPMTVYKRPYQGEVSSVWDNDLIDAEATKANYAYAAKLSMEHGYTVSVQMHTFLNIA